LSPPNSTRRGGSVSAGSGELRGLPLLVRARAPLRAARRMVGERAVRRAPVVDAEPAAAALTDRDVENLLERLEYPAALATAKDLEYLRWRYAAPAYRAIRTHRRGELSGIAIFRVFTRDRLDVASVSDLLVDSGEFAVAHRLVRSVVRTAPVDLIRCRFRSGSTPHRAALLAGFVPAPSRLVPTVRSLRPDMLAELRRRDGWALCEGDFDLL
jgi:hypothetical protein